MDGYLFIARKKGDNMIKFIKENYTILIFAFIMSIVVQAVIAHYKEPKAFQFSNFMIGKIEIESEHFCRYSLGRDVNKKFKEDFVVIERCGMYNVKDNLLLIKGLPNSEPIKKGK